jgi:hypothetical protein
MAGFEVTPQNLDLVISVDTAVAHLAGALAKPVWLLLPFAPDWRWMLDREDSPWYPAMRLLRQRRPGDWEGVFAGMREELVRLAGSRGEGPLTSPAPSPAQPRLPRVLVLSYNNLGNFGDRLDIWYARYEEDVLLYGGKRGHAIHLGDWLIEAFPMAEGRNPDLLVVGDEIWQDLPLDRTIQRIQSHRRVLSTRVHPLLCALTSASEVAYREQREDGSGAPSGKFRSMLMDVFGREFPEQEFFEVDRGAVIEYKEHVRQRIQRMREYFSRLLEAPGRREHAPGALEFSQNAVGAADMPADG